MSHVDAPWDFSAIAASDLARAQMLATAPTKTLITSSVLARFEDAIRTRRLRVGMDESSRSAGHLRLTLQFHIGETLSDQFFNATTGYRAQFRLDWRRGLNYNNLLIKRIRTAFGMRMPETFPGRRLSHKFDDRGPMTISRERACASLVPELSKIWFCGRLIVGSGNIQQLPTGITGPRLKLPGGTSWAAIWRDEASAWLDVKGAFLASDDAYQLKDPVERAKKLAASGEA